MEHSKIAIVIGTNAELIKCVPIMKELRSREKDYWFVHTGQHDLRSLCKSFGVKEPDFVLSGEEKIGKFSSKITLKTFIWNVKTMLKIRSIIRGLSPNYVIFHGDTMNTAMAVGATAGVLNPFKKWKTVHLESGLRSGSWKEPLPEEFIRVVADRFSDILLAVSDWSKGNLDKYRHKKVANVGNTILDSAEIAYEEAKKVHKREKGEYVLINIHRHENLKSRDRMEKIVEIVNSIKSKSIWPIHRVTKKTLEEYGLMEKLKANPKVKITSLTDYHHFIFMVANCKYLVTDGGSIQEESLIFRKPCLILRERTERQEGLSTGLNFITMDVEKGKEIIKRLEGNIEIKDFKNPYGEKGVSKKILEILK